jgi:signal transduction histidine kinase
MLGINHYQLSVGLTAVISGALAIFVFIAGDKRRLIKIYALHAATISVWAFCWLVMITASNSHTKAFFCRLLHVPAVFLPALFLLFVQSLLKTEQDPFQKTLRMGMLTCAFIWIVFFPTQIFIPTLTRQPSSYLFEPGPLYLGYTVYFLSVIGLSFYYLLRGHQTSSGAHRRQIAHIIGAYSIGYGGGLAVFLLIYHVPIPPWVLYSIPIAHVWILYAIVRHRLLDIRVVIRRTGLLAFIYILLIFALITLLKILLEPTPVPVGVILFAGSILSFGPFIYAFTIRRSRYFHEDSIASLTHEMKTPLAAIQSALSIIADHKTSSNEKNDEYLSMIESNAARLEEFVNFLIEVMSDEKPHSAIHIQNVDIAQLCRQVADSMQSLASFKNNRIVLEIPKEPVVVSVDSQKISQSVSNILSNAIKFTDQDQIVMKVQMNDSDVSVSVRDRGIGLSQRDITRIFDRFYQSEAGKLKKGTGIGLTLAKIWIEAHGGKIWAESDGEGKGATVTFTLPI